VIVYNECTVCTDYYSVDEQSCNKTCSRGLIIDNARKRCYKHKNECPGFISSDGT